MKYEIEVTEKPAQPVLAVRTRTAVGNLGRECGRIFPQIIGYLEELRETPHDAGFVGYFNMDMDNLDVEIGFPVSKPLPGKGEIKSGEIPAGTQVSCMHKGPYGDVGAVYDVMMKFVAENGYTATGISYEFYYNSPDEVPESELLTRVIFPLK